ncbi:MAG TPA: adenosylmethionine--8-amino-7-oxononanoate transaminase [Flavobacteriales bacterium]|nr:adenosylmethionine--8-amino-7-oxononanoate transaminase [Flavobacteriales bacterium]HRJ40026.1 adenosylmethionine--8-amino-7-oxononanoate transaminase [Flavobacteriales bacterium]
MNISDRDQATIWHPFTQMKLQGKLPAVVGAEGTKIFLEDGSVLLDMISSWWVNVHGHAHPHSIERITEQVKKLDQVIFAGFTHEPAVVVAEKLLPLLPGNPSRLFFSDNGSTAVEVALKMAIQYFHNKGKARTRIIAFENAYHGDTFGAMAVGGRSVFNTAFESLFFEVDHIPVPVQGREQECLEVLDSLLRSQEPAAIILEPLVQGSAGMVMYAPEMLNEIVKRCREKGVLIIADEVFTGMGRTGKLFAFDHIAEKPDIICVSKGITGGFLPLGLTACKAFIYDAFYSDDKMKALYHGHSYTANPLACAAAIASLELFEHPATQASIERITQKHKAFVKQYSGSPNFRAVRSTGTILAIEFETGNSTSYFNDLRDKLYAYFIKKGLLMRPLGNVVYVLPPYCVTDDELEIAYQAIAGLSHQPLTSLL